MNEKQKVLSGEFHRIARFAATESDGAPEDRVLDALHALLAVVSRVDSETNENSTEGRPNLEKLLVSNRRRERDDGYLRRGAIDHVLLESILMLHQQFVGEILPGFRRMTKAEDHHVHPLGGRTPESNRVRTNERLEGRAPTEDSSSFANRWRRGTSW